MIKFTYLDENEPAYLEVEECNGFVDNIKLSVWAINNPLQIEGLSVLWQLPIHIKGIPIRIPESKRGSEYDYGFVDWEYISDIHVEIVPDLDFLTFPFTVKELSKYLENLGLGWKSIGDEF